MRHEPDVGELNVGYLFDVLDEVAAACEWSGWVGCEYRPAKGVAPNATSDGLGWLRDAQASRPPQTQWKEKGPNPKLNPTPPPLKKRKEIEKPTVVPPVT